MTEFESIQSFVSKSKRLTRLHELERLLDEAVTELGFDYFALGHHVDLEFPPGDAIVLMKYPEAWLEVMLREKYFVDDPVLAATQRAVAPFAWEDVASHVNLSARHRLILARAAQNGLGEGFTVPMHVAGEFSGSCNFGMKTGRAMPVAALPAIQYLGCFAFEAARRIRRLELRRGRRHKPMPLSPRQIDCIVLLARGMSDEEIARALGIRRDTVTEYVEEAKLRVGARKRPDLLVKALYNGDVALGEILTSRSPRNGGAAIS